MKLFRRLFGWIDRDLPKPANYLCVICGHERRQLEAPKIYCKCGNKMVRLDS